VTLLQPSYPLSQLRPTLIIGLGGSGYQIAVHLKARLVEQYGAGDALDSAVQFVCIDTANENFSATQPNSPDAPPVTLSRETEFVRISDVPLHELMQRREDNPAIASILPERLRSTHIDQGAQQIRRLGRVALLYRFDRIRGRLGTAISSLLSIQNQRGTDRRLRVIIACSICGGTGSGTFIDIAYLVRHIAMTDGTAKTARDIDVIGMLLLPEVFRSIRSTGEDRIRANAYAALLDLEYYNQATSADQALYSMNGLRGGKIEIEGAPFDQCFLINASEGGTVKGVRELAPILADSLQLMIASRVGEQLSATFDNLKTNNLTRYYPPGFRAFYSAIGMAQIVYPRRWLSRRFALGLKKALIDRVLLAPADPEDAARRAASWVSEALDRAIDPVLRRTADAVASAIMEDWEIAVQGAQDLIDLQRAWKTVRALVQGEYSTALGEARRVAARTGTNALHEAVTQIVGRLARDPQAPGATTAENGFGGLSASARWLEAVRQAIYRRIDGLRREFREPDFDAAYREAISGAGRGGIGRRRRLDEIAEGLSAYAERATSRESGTHIVIRIELLEALLDEVRDQARRVGVVIEGLTTLRATLDIQLVQDAPLLTSVSQPVVDLDRTERILQRWIERQLTDDGLITTYNALLQSLPGFAGVLPDDVRAIDSYSLPDALLDQLDTYCRRLGDQAVAEESSVSQQIDRRAIKGEGEARWRDKLLQQWMNQAKPFLTYRDGLIADLRISTVRVIGVQTDEDDERLSAAVDRSDTAVVTTGDGEHLTVLHTEHGVPMHVLRNIDEYRQRYLELASQRDAMLHMSRELERAPYDPGSAYFLDLEDFDLYMARACAYSWLRLDQNSRQFVLSAAFYSAFSMVIDEQRVRLEVEIAARGRTIDERGGKGKSPHIEQEKEQLERTRAELIRRFEAIAPLDRADAPDARFMLALPAQGRLPLVPAVTLDLARQCLLGGSTLLLPRLFSQAFNGLADAPGFDTRGGIEHFLTVRRYSISEDVDRISDNAPLVQMKWSQPGDPSYPIEVRFCGLLAAYDQAVVRSRRVRRRKPRAGYWSPSPFDAEIGGTAGGGDS